MFHIILCRCCLQFPPPWFWCCYQNIGVFLRCGLDLLLLWASARSQAFGGMFFPSSRYAFPNHNCRISRSMRNVLVPTSCHMISQKVYNLATIIIVYYLGHTVEFISTLKTLGITLCSYYLPTHSISHQRLNIVCILKTSNLGEGVGYIMGAWQVLHTIFLLDVYWGPL